MGITVVVPSSGRPVPIEWALGIATLSYPVGMSHAWLVNKKGTDDPNFTRAEQRETLAERAAALGSEYIMCFDDDTVPPAHAIQSLWYVLSQHPEAAICGGIYCSKEDKPSPLVFKELGAGPFWNWTLGDIFPCKSLGLGCMMVRMSALKALPKPWFLDFSKSDPGRKEKVGEIEIAITGDTGTDDSYLCQKMTEAGHVILAHGGVLPMHIGEDGRQYVLPEDSYPIQSYLKKKAEMEAQGRDPRNRESKVTE
jgi:hypothetical protein